MRKHESSDGGTRKLCKRGISPKDSKKPQDKTRSSKILVFQLGGRNDNSPCEEEVRHKVIIKAERGKVGQHTPLPPACPKKKKS